MTSGWMLTTSAQGLHGFINLPGGGAAMDFPSR
jgi:hypothetical protein